MNRRSFLGAAAARLSLLSASAAWRAARDEPAREWAADVVIAGGGMGGCAAALAACRAGLSVILTEPTDWIGGQLTAQAVPPDEHPWIESFGCTRAYRRYRQAVRDYYRDHFPLTAEARARPHLNPGSGSVSRLCHEPRVSVAVLEAMLAPFVAGRRLRLLTEHAPVAADVDGDRVRALTVRSLRHDRRVTLTAPYFVDATELGDLLSLTRTEYVTGAESRRETGEERAPAEAQPANQQAFTCCFAVDYLAGEDHTIEKPAEYAFWRSYVPRLRPPWPAPLLSWEATHPVTLEPRRHFFDPSGAAPPDGKSLFIYRRIADPLNFAPGTYPGGMTLVNWPQNDYWLGPLVDVPPEEAARSIARAKQLSLSLVYWMQTEAPRPDGGAGWKGLRLRDDVMDTPDGLAKHPYIREARRIRAEVTVTADQVGTDARAAATGKPRAELTAAPCAESVGVGAYRIDLHPSTGGDNYIDLSSLPFQIPLGALIPRRVENLLPAAKNIGTTHLTNGCYRLHPVEWNIGEAVGALLAFCRTKREPPRQVRRSAQLLAEFQQALRDQGFELEWPRLRPL